MDMSLILRRAFHMREGEMLRSASMFLYIFFLIASLMIVKPVRNSLFLVTHGAGQLPYVFVLVAICVALFALVYSRIARERMLDHLILHTLVVSIACMFLFWLLLHGGYRHSLVPYALYVWVSLFGGITSAQFWLLANYLFDAREAKRLFGFLGAGAISGGIAGGYLTNLLAPLVRTENLLFVCIGFLIACALLFLVIWKRNAHRLSREKDRRRAKAVWGARDGNPVRLIVSSRYLRAIAAIIGVGIAAATLVDYQFSAIASRLITDTDELTAFFGFWLSTVSLVSLGVQLSLTGTVMRRLGVTASLFFLPFGILVGACAVLLAPGIGSAILVKLADGGLKHSINKAGVELLSLPILPEIKMRVKGFMDIFVDNVATGLAGVLLIVLTIVLGASVSQVSLVLLVLIAAWIYFIVKVRHEYVNAFRTAIEKRAIDLDDQKLSLQDASLFASLVKTLEAENARQVAYVLRLFEDIHNETLIPHLERLIRHPSHEVKAQVLRMASSYQDLDLHREAEELALSPDEDLRLEAVRYLCRRAGNRREALGTYQNHADYRVRASALMCQSMAVGENESAPGRRELREWLDDLMRDWRLPAADEEQKRFMKVSAAKAIGVAGLPELSTILRELLDDESPDVLQAAARSAGRIRDPELVPVLVRLLGTKNVRRFARESLAEYGEAIVEVLLEHLEDPTEKRNLRHALPGTLALIGSQKSVNALMRNIAREDPSLRYEIVKALNKLRVRYRGLRIDRPVVAAQVVSEAMQYYRTSTILSRQRGEASAPAVRPAAGGPGADATGARRLLVEALEERLGFALERIFRLLGLVYPAGDMYSAYLGVTSRKARQKANAIEFLDNVLDPRLKKLIVPIVESFPAEPSLRNARELLGFDIPSDEESVALILQGDDNWLKACAVYLVAEMGWHYYTDYLTGFTRGEDPILRETALYCMGRLGKAGEVRRGVEETKSGISGG